MRMGRGSWVRSWGWVVGGDLLITHDPFGVTQGRPEQSRMDDSRLIPILLLLNLIQIIFDETN